ncbi:hypothetical protein SprV_0702431800 [Sparganum proliferum]
MSSSVAPGDVSDLCAMGLDASLTSQYPSGSPAATVSARHVIGPYSLLLGGWFAQPPPSAVYRNCRCWSVTVHLLDPPPHTSQPPCPDGTSTITFLNDRRGIHGVPASIYLADP